MRSHALARLLLDLPDADVFTWDPGPREEREVEQAIVTREGSVVLGMELSPSWTVDGAAIVWCADESARSSLERAQARWDAAKREWV